MASTRWAKVELTADARGLERGLQRGKASVNNFRASIGKSTSKLGSALMTGVGFGTMAAGVALIGNEIRSALNFDEQLTRFKIASGQSASQMDSLRESIEKTSTASGVSREDMLSGAQAFIALTGDAKGAIDAMDLFSKVNVASGASMEDIASTAAALTQNLQIPTKDLQHAFDILISGGKAGAIELKDVAGLMAELAPLGAQFAGGLGTEGMTSLSAALQLTRQGFGSASEAATGLQALMGSIVKHSDRLEDGGVNVFTKDEKGNKKLKGFQEIIEDIGNSKLIKDPHKLTKALGGKEAYSAFLQLTKVEGAWDGLADKTRTANDVAEDYATMSGSAAGKMIKTWNEFKNTIHAAFGPENLQAFLGMMTGLASAAGKVVGTLAQLPSVGGDIADWVYKVTHADDPKPQKKKDFTKDKSEADQVRDELAASWFGGGDLVPHLKNAADGVQGRVGAAQNARLRAYRMQQGGTGPIAGIPQDTSGMSFNEPDAMAPSGAPWVARKPVGSGTGGSIRVSMDPSTTNLRGKFANSREHTKR